MIRPGEVVVRCSFLLLVLPWVLGSAAVAQTSKAPADAVVESLEEAAVRTLSFTQGDRASLTDVRDRFTSTGWSEFLGGLKGWLDDAGAPSFSSAFTPSGPALDVHFVDGSIRLTVPGVLEQRTRNAAGGVSTTSYRAEIDIEARADSARIQRLSQRTCGGSSTVASCR